MARFDALEAIEPDELLGIWRGQGVPTGHPLDGLLESLGWYGKAFEPPDRVHALLFQHGSGPIRALDPAWMPTPVALAWPSVARHPTVRLAFRAAGPVLQARGPTGRTERREFRGRRSAALVYGRQPIVDHFRRIDPDRVMGLMTRTGMARPFVFLLTRETGRVELKGNALRRLRQGPDA